MFRFLRSVINNGTRIGLSHPDRDMIANLKSGTLRFSLLLNMSVCAVLLSVPTKASADILVVSNKICITTTAVFCER